MPYAKKYSSASSTRQIALKALRATNEVKKQIEVKHLDTVSSDATLASAGRIDDIFAPATGTGDNGRIGDKVMVKHMSMRMNLGATATTGTGNVRVIVLQLKTITSSVPSITEILRSAVPWSLYNINTSVNYKLLMDQTYLLQGSNSNGSVKPIHLIKKEFKVGSTYDNDGTQIDGRLVHILLHDGGDETVAVNWEYRTRYTDL